MPAPLGENRECYLDQIVIRRGHNWERGLEMECLKRSKKAGIK